ncbi:TetR/AcrR family transcriptional regulator [Nocardioides sp. R-C-SC26]|uniref:TetR/AcrR family transcriptional regulator n=1 Tax=Nocardioides sp. R-C-SC26 TaxID=2870414 RepID=UPI001E63E0F6|nr:TetR/AcrR family transcriptional regulator [Nocardioides sp. R-C-SC26]
MGTASNEAPLVARLDDARRAVYREHILDVAEAEFGRCGFSAAKVGDIATRAGISLATLYKTFASKADLWDALNTDRMEEFTRVVTERTSAIASPLERLLVGARAEVEFFAARDAFLQLHLRDGLSWGTASTFPGAGQGAQRVAWRTGMAMTAATAQEAIDAGELRQVRSEVAAAIVISSLQIWLTDWIATGRSRPIDQVADDVEEHLRRSLAV